MHTPTRTALLGALAVLSIVGLGSCADGPGREADGARIVEIEMRDAKFDPGTVKVTAGEKVSFHFHNAGQVRHEAVIGAPKEQEAHEVAMGSAPADTGTDHAAMGHGEHAGDVLSLEPGEKGVLEYTFTEDQVGTELLIGCHEAGHWLQGMKATIEVRAAA